MGITRLVLAVNKMDLVGFERTVFEQIVGDFGAFAAGFPALDIIAMPLCARDGDNVSAPSPRTPPRRRKPLSTRRSP